MKHLGRATLKVADIVVGDRLRQIDPAHADLLAESLRQTGRLRQPPEVRRQKKGAKITHTLIAGGHRMRAVQIVGWDEIEVEIYEGGDDEARLWEIDENLIRHDLNPLDRAVFLHQRKEIYERLYPEAKAGGDRGNQHTGGRQTDTMSFSQATAEKCGWTERTIRRATAIAEGLKPDIRARLVGTALSRNQAELLKLVKLSNGQQHAALNLLLAVPAQARNVEEARRIIVGARAAAPASDDGFAALLSKWTRATPRERSAFLDHLWNHKTDDTLRAFVAGLNPEEAA